MKFMQARPDQPIDLPKADQLLKEWWQRHDTLEKVPAPHRKALLERVV